MKQLALKAIMLSGLILGASSLAHAQTFDDLMRSTRNGDAALLIHLLQQGAWLDSVDAEGNTLLMQAIAEFENGVASILIDAGARLDTRNRHGDSALQLAALKGNVEIVKRLLESGAKVEQDGWTALHYAAYSGHSQIAALLLDHSADPDAIALNGATPLMLAAANGFIDVVRELMKQPLSLNVRGSEGLTALGLALRANNTDIAALLRKAGARE